MHISHLGDDNLVMDCGKQLINICTVCAVTDSSVSSPNGHSDKLELDILVCVCTSVDTWV